MLKEYDNSTRQKLVDMPTLNDINLPKDVKSPEQESDSQGQPFDSSDIHESSVESPLEIKKKSKKGGK
jgi:hypothetical protein